MTSDYIKRKCDLKRHARPLNPYSLKVTEKAIQLTGRAKLDNFHRNQQKAMETKGLGRTFQGKTGA